MEGLSRFARLTALAVFIATIILSAASSAGEFAPGRCQVSTFRPFAAKVWNARWQRGAPAPATIHAAHRRIECAPPRHRRAMQRTWRRQRAHYFARRASKLRQRRLDALTPFGAWAIPGYIVACESGGDFRAYNAGYEPDGPGTGPGGAYQIIWQTWNAYAPRRFVDYAASASKLEQHRTAGKIWADVGPAAWACA